MYTLSEIAQISGGELIGKTNPTVNNFVTDSRQLLNTKDSVFFAIKSNRNDGHFYIDTLVRLGLKAFVITDKTKIKDSYLSEGVSFVVVSNALTSLQLLAAHHRLKFKLPIIGITGSNGKTIVKEWLYQLLSDDYTICRSPKSYNSQIGVPLSVLNINQNHNLGIFEAGISLPNEMNKLQEIVKPTLGVFTSFGEAHSQGFESNKHKLTEKLKLFEDCNKVIFNAFEHEDLLEYLSAKFVSIGSNKNCNYNLSFQIKSNFTEIVLSALGKSYSYKIHFIDKASVLNASTCIVTLMEMGLDQSLIQQKLSKLQSIALRLEVKNATQNSILINDFYNSDIDSIKIALGFLNQQHRRKNKVLIISDLDETGKPEQELYTELSKLIEESKIDFLVCIGEALNRNGKLFKTKSVFFNGVKDFLAEQSVLKVNFKDATILLKGAHRFKFEDISKLLQLKSHDTVLEINLNKLQHNVNYYRSLIGKEVQLMCMVKAMGYGSGGSEIARSLQHLGVNYLAVAYADEGVELRDSNISVP
ncbi:MAG: alanine racemase, partial [Bacteroidia bacterium]|nr:alanine racemase [Bacteroidia bacterium]